MTNYELLRHLARALGILEPEDTTALRLWSTQELIDELRSRGVIKGMRHQYLHQDWHDVRVSGEG